MNPRRILLYTVGLLILAFALGSLPRGSPGGSLLFQSTWLLYLIYLGPVIVLGAMIALILMMAYYWKDIGEAIGFKSAQERRMRKKRSRYTFLVWAIMWAIAIGVLLTKQGTIFNPMNEKSLVADITGQNGGPPNQILAGLFFPAISSFVQIEWFGVAFLGLLVVGGLVLVQSIRASLKETGDMRIEELQARRIEGLQAAQYAIKLVDDNTADPRTRIINCFQHMIVAVERLGVPVASDMTARELESAIRSTFALKGDSTSELTQLFEEARYSLHEISNNDAANAGNCLEAIEEELRIPIDN